MKAFLIVSLAIAIPPTIVMIMVKLNERRMDLIRREEQRKLRIKWWETMMAEPKKEEFK